MIKEERVNETEKRFEKGLGERYHTQQQRQPPGREEVDRINAAVAHFFPPKQCLLSECLLLLRPTSAPPLARLC